MKSVLASITILFSQLVSAQAGTSFPFATVQVQGQHAQFVVSQEDQTGTWLNPLKMIRAENSDRRIFVFDQALRHCHLNLDRLTNTWRNFDDEFSTSWQSLNQIFHHVQDRISKIPFAILITYLPRPLTYSAGFLQNFPEDGQNAVLLDCSLFQNGSWPESLAHELTHLLLHKAQLPPWWEEMTAAWITAQVSRNDPDSLILPLTKMHTLPSPFFELWPSELAPFGINYLFIKFLQEHYGNELTLRALDPYFNISQCPRTQDHLRWLLCRWHALSLSSMHTPSEIFEPNAILAHFALTLVINRQNINLVADYSLPGWPGFQSTAKSTSESEHLRPGQIRRLKTAIKTKFVQNDGLQQWKITFWQQYFYLRTQETWQTPTPWPGNKSDSTELLQLGVWPIDPVM